MSALDPKTAATNAEVDRQAAEAESRHAAICERLGPMSSSVWPYVVRPYVERQARERNAWARLVEAATALRDAVASDLADRERGCRPADLWPERAEVSLAKQALRDLGVDVDALLGEP